MAKKLHTGAEEYIIEAHGLGYVYPQPPTLALQNVTLSLPRGQFVAIIGPNGAGKTTFVKLLLGVLRPTQGEIFVEGQPPFSPRSHIHHRIGYVPQHRTVNQAMPVRVRDVVGMAAACRYAGQLSGADIRRRIQRALELVELSDLASRPFATLSGGQQQRALIARALVVDPVVLVADEPFAAVDARSSQAILSLLHWLTREKSVTVLTVVHDINPLVHSLDRIVLLNKRMIAFGTPADVLRPDLLQEAYGRAVPILVCEEGYLHPLTDTQHG